MSDAEKLLLLLELRGYRLAANGRWRKTGPALISARQMADIIAAATGRQPIGSATPAPAESLPPPPREQGGEEA